jgi:hypothetical protein
VQRDRGAVISGGVAHALILARHLIGRRESHHDAAENTYGRRFGGQGFFLDELQS